jgi:RNA polymerase-binding transcription factor DksA
VDGGRRDVPCLGGAGRTDRRVGTTPGSNVRRVLYGCSRRGAASQAVNLDALDNGSLLDIGEAEQERTDRQIASLEAIVAGIVEASELISTDDEHDPEGATVAYERAQASALLRQARADRDALVVTRRQLELGQRVVCAVCGRNIDFERVAAVPTTSRCVRCAA